ncbi:LIM homeobox transcription factor 1-beta isoform X2 [Bemisia tabaci]|uniref:LIM homeobox transcription factor 1-beta isoform X2 n=1 Tax=Bemisia tabaci TaxID=7038 RepID=UPI0008F9A594|nr:PREDICTED: LIM homeobox transcription factor 1-beta.1 isoform X2 [Bemisia tabaci]
MVQSMVDSLHPCITGPEAIKSEKCWEVCEGCGQQIQDRFLMRVGVGEASWHESCLACSVCASPLSRSCYIRDNKLFCKPDYDRLFGAKCLRCAERVLPHEMIMRAQNHIFHLQCFVCVICCQPLQKGEQFVLRAGQLFCRQDFEKEMFLLQQSPSDELLLDDTSRPRDGRRGPKRPRTILTSAQRRQFKASFEVSPKPCRKVREALAKDTGLSVRVVQVWFQNQRAKMKKIQRKAKIETDKSSSEKDEKSDGHGHANIKQESINSDHNHYLSLSSLNMHDSGDAPFLSGSGQPLNPNQPYSPDDGYPTHSGDSFCSSDISLDGSTNLDEGGSDSLSLPPPSHEGILHGTLGQVNPIDKLYLMQNSYFSNSEQ